MVPAAALGQAGTPAPLADSKPCMRAMLSLRSGVHTCNQHSDGWRAHHPAQTLERGVSRAWCKCRSGGTYTWPHEFCDWARFTYDYSGACGLAPPGGRLCRVKAGWQTEVRRNCKRLLASCLQIDVQWKGILRRAAPCCGAEGGAVGQRARSCEGCARVTGGNAVAMCSSSNALPPHLGGV